MSLSSTSTIKHQLSTILGPKSKTYFDTLHKFIAGRLSRVEFDDSVRQSLGTAQLIQLHNALIISLFDASSHRRPPTPPPDLPKPPPRKRRRTLPYQGPDTADETLRSSRLKRWTLSVGKRERDRLRMLQVPQLLESPRSRKDTDEIARGRGVVLLPERGDPPGSRLPLHLASVTRAPTLQHISDRINLISAQHNLGAPSRAVSQLMMLAFEAKLKQLITHALTLTSTSHVISSIQPTTSTPTTTHSLVPHAHRTPLLTPSSFSTLFTLAPFTLPNSSAAATCLALSAGDDGDEYGLGAEDSGVWVGGGREVRDQRWQMVALLGERSTVREALRGVR